MSLSLLVGTCSKRLGERVARALDIPPVPATIERFPDGEMHIQIEASVRARDVFVLQSTGPMVDTNLMELLLLVDACRRAGAGRITAVVPYLGYARQDRRARGREPLSARLVADLLGTAGVERLVVVDLHNAGLEGLFPFPIEQIAAAPLLVERLRDRAASKAVIVAPDLGSVRRAEYYSRHLDLPMAVVHKMRISGSEVAAERVTGEVSRLSPIIIDDMIASGSTVELAIEQCLAGGCQPDFTVVATHGVLAPGCVDRLQRRSVGRLLLTDSLHSACGDRIATEIASLDSLLADAITRLHGGHSMGSLTAR